MMIKTNVKIIPVLLSLLCFCSSLNAQFRASDYETVAKDAAWCWFSDPRAVYHKGKEEKVYFSYINSRGDVVISSRDLRTKAVKTFTLHAALQVDDHNVPSILFLPDGKILAFYTEHNGRFFMRKSKNSEDISAWDDERIIPFGGKRITYSHPAMLSGENNRIYMFWRGSDWRPSLSFSDDLGNTWSPPQPLIESKGTKNRPYLKVGTDSKNRIDFAFTDGHPAVEPANSVYHIYYEDGKFYQTNGDMITSIKQLPIEHNKVTKVYDGTVNNIKAWISDITLGKHNKPVLVYVRFPEDTDHRYHYAAWDGSAWKDEEICKAGGWMPVVKSGEKAREPNYSGGVAIDHKDPSNVYLSREIEGVFEIEHRQKRKKAWRTVKITEQSEMSNMRPYVVMDYPSRRPIVLWMTGLYNHYTNFKTDLLINELSK